MKTNALKSMIKEVVKEAIQEELKEILLEAIKSPKSPINEALIPQVNIGSREVTTPNTRDMKSQYENMMGALDSTTISRTTQDMAPISPMNADPVNGQLPQGSISLDQIGNLLNTK